MRQLHEIVTAARLGKPLSPDEARDAIIAFDVLMAQLNLPQDPQRLQEYFKAAELPPAEYYGWANDPKNPEFVAWYGAFNSLPSLRQDVLDEPGNTSADHAKAK